MSQLGAQSQNRKISPPPNDRYNFHQEGHTYAIFLENPGYKDIKIDITNCQIYSYTNITFKEVLEIPNTFYISEYLVVEWDVTDDIP